jgi:mitochondrial GTPase 1
MRSFKSSYSSSISWFPGHMAKAQRHLAGLLSSCDVVIEVRDARIPFSSATPSLLALSGSKPRVVVLNKADLAHAPLAARVRDAVALEARAPAVLLSAKQLERGGAARLLALVDSLETKATAWKAVGTKMAVVGAPNTGKSSLINALRACCGYTGSRGALVAPVPGFTRSLSSIRIRETPPLYLLDTPGILMPKLTDVEQGLKLCLTACVRAAAVPPIVQAEYLLYSFATLGATAWASALKLSRAFEEQDVEPCLAELALKLGALRAGGEPDLEFAATHLVRAFQDGQLGRHTLDFIDPQLETQPDRREEQREVRVGLRSASARFSVPTTVPSPGDLPLAKRRGLI